MVRVGDDRVLLCPGLWLGVPNATEPAVNCAGIGTSGGAADGCLEDRGGVSGEAGSGGEGAMGWC